MKNLLVILGIMVAAFVMLDMFNRQSAPQKPVASGSNNVIMYSTATCGYCKKAKKLFEEKNIAYVECDVGKSSQCNQAFAALKGRGVPLFDIKGTIIHGYNQEYLLATLKSENIPFN